MPFFLTAAGPVLFAHVPKCGGTSVEEYLRDRFGPLAFHNKAFNSLPVDQRWSRTSPQHIDWTSAQQIFPPDFFVAAFAVVRHPVARAASAYRFQVQTEKSVSAEVPFADWLRSQSRALRDDPFVDDNHLRPQSDFIPDDCAIFHLEYGLDAIIPWLDSVSGDNAGPRSVSHDNKSAVGDSKARFEPDSADIALICEIYAADFERFAYQPGQKLPIAKRPELGADFLAQAQRDRQRAGGTLARTGQRVKRRLRKWLG